MDIPTLDKWAGIKGISLLGTGDFTHPEWLKILKENLEEAEYGLYKYKNTYFILTAEVSNIYFKAGKTRRIHNIIFAPSFEIAEEINKSLGEYGKLSSDGRPILSLEADRLVKKVSGISLDSFVVPAHIWTPHFSLFGSNSGFDKIEECFEGETSKIYALETGLSSDPPMSWRISSLDRMSLISNSDAHSPDKIGREANVFNKKFSYKELIEILRTRDAKRFLYTIEFFPEEGKYHYDGHRACNLRLSPGELKNVAQRCPNCGKKLTIGVLNRAQNLSDRPEKFILKDVPGFKSLVPLNEIIAQALNIGKDSVGVEREYQKLIGQFGSEFGILLEVSEKELLDKCNPRIAKGIVNVRIGNVKRIPGYDGVYGSIKVLEENIEEENKQLEFF